jgi:methionine synthase I (cobalamin-dependent)
MSLDLREFGRSVRVLDGAWGTQLQARGLPAGACPERWNTEHPEAVEAVARGYVEAGSDVILTNTFGGNRFVLAAHDEAGRAAELCEAGAAISRRAAGEAVKVFGSIGPTGKIVMTGEVAEDRLAAAFAEAAEALAWGGADAFILETFNELAEARIALRAVREAAAELPVVVSMTFASGPEKSRTMMGNSPAELAGMAEAEGAAAVGANCGVGPDNYVGVARLLAEATDLPVWIKANAGLPEMVRGRVRYPMGPEQFAGAVPALIEAGARFIGGCCGTGPDHVRAIRKAVEEHAR